MKNFNNYFIKKGYQSNIVNRTLESCESTYWTTERIRMSHYFQYHVYKLAGRLLKTGEINNVLDVGCGVATKLMKLIYPICQDIVGIDQSSAIEICKKKYGDDKFYTDDFEAPTLELNRKFDLIICSDVIEHVVDPDILLNYIKRFSHKGSLIVFSTPERDLLRGAECMVSKKPEHVREWNQAEFLAYLRSRGLVINISRLDPPMKINLSMEYVLFLKRVFMWMHSFNTMQVVVARLAAVEA